MTERKPQQMPEVCRHGCGSRRTVEAALAAA